jgi:hypothetical protein
MDGKRGLLTLAAALACAAFTAAARADTVDYLALDDASRRAVESACSGWVYRDARDRIAPWLDAVSPLCAAEEALRPGRTPVQGAAQPAGEEIDASPQ